MPQLRQEDQFHQRRAAEEMPFLQDFIRGAWRGPRSQSPFGSRSSESAKRSQHARSADRAGRASRQAQTEDSRHALLMTAPILEKQARGLR